MKTIIAAAVAFVVVWLRAAKVIDIDPETEAAIVSTIGVLIAIFMRLGIFKAQKAAENAGVKAETAVGQAAEEGATSALRAERTR